ncbi:MAG: potassium channel family protein [Sphaerochaetaceae bacterium]|nr:potassium channel family protein [Sphaerochaetaceae bacterium]
MKIRKRIFEIISIADGRNDIISRIYDFILVVTVFVSFIPLLTKGDKDLFRKIDIITFAVLMLDYLLHWLCCDFSIRKKFFSFILYPFTLGSIISLLAIIPPYIAVYGPSLFSKLSFLPDTSFLPDFASLPDSAFLMKLFVSLRLLKVLRITRYFTQFFLLIKVFKKQKQPLMVVLSLAVIYIFVVALILYLLEDDLFANYFEAIYWATISLTSVGYGDFVPHTNVGRLVAMISSVLGIALIALPSGIISAGYMDELNRYIKNEEKKKQ